MSPITALSRTLLIALLMLATLVMPRAADAVTPDQNRAPITFWTVRNWYGGDWVNIRYSSPREAFTADWNKQSGQTLCGNPPWPYSDPYSRWDFVDIFPIDNPNLPSGSTYGAHYQRQYCSNGQYDGYGPQLHPDDAARWVICPDGTGAWSTDSFPNGCAAPTGADPDENGGCPTCKAGVKAAMVIGEPINTGTGNEFKIKTEYRGSGPFPLDFTWTYNSFASVRIDTPAEAILGANRADTYHRRIRVYAVANFTTAYVSRPDGNTLHFNRSGANWVADSDLEGILTSIRDGNDQVTSWSYRNTQNETEVFDAAGTLQSITDANGYTQALSYDTSHRVASVRDMAGRQLAFTYSANNRLAQLTLPDGKAVLFAYDGNDNLQTVTYPDGSYTTYLYNEPAYTSNTNLPHALTGEQDETGNRYATTSYDTRGRAISSFLASNFDHYDATYTDSSDGSYAATAAITSPLNKTRTVTYQTVHGRVLPTGYVDSCSGCPSQTKAFNYAASGHVSSTSDYADVVTTYTQDANGLETERIESANIAATKRTIDTTWDTALREPTERFVYDSSASQPGVLKAREQWTYNARGQVLTHIAVGANNPANTRPTAYAYCEPADVTAGTCPLVGLLTKVSGPRPNTADDVTFAYYASDDATCASAPSTCPHRKGDLYTVTQTAGTPLVTTYLKYDGAGRPLQMSDANGVVTDVTYNARGWLTRAIVRGIDNNSTIDDAITTIAYDPTGTVSKITQPDGDYLSYTYDVAHRLTDVSDNLGRTIHYTLDAVGNRTTEDSKNSSGVLKHTLSRVYDQLGRVQRTLNAASQATLIAYDVNDNVDLVSDPNNHTSDQDVDALGRVIRTTQDIGPGALNVATQYQYNALDEVTQITDPKGLNTTYAYNGFGELTALTSPDTGTTTYTLDNAGNRLTQVDARNVTTSYGYDALNRLSSVSYPATPALNVAYTYDTINAICASGEIYAKGHLSKFTDSTGNTQFCYDRFGNLTRKQQVNGAFTQTTLFEYTLGGRLYRVTYPSGAQATYGRNAADQISSVQITVAGVTSTLVSSVNYMPFGPLNVLTFGNGRTLTSQFDLDYNFNYNYDPAAGGLNLTATVDAVGNVRSLVSTLNGAATTRNYGYDGLDRLTLVTTPGAASLDERFTYDGTGDRQSKKIGAGATQTYVYPGTSHQLASVAGVARTYDAAGNTLTAYAGASALTFSYDDRGRMSQSTLGGAVYRNYGYNARGERVQKNDPAHPTNSVHFIYDEAGHLLGDYANSGTVLREYVWLDDTLVGVIAPSEGSTAKFEYVETDQLGTPRVVIDPIRNVAIWRWSVTGSAFGDNVPDQDADGNGTSWAFNLRYPGQYYDGAAGLPVYNYFRDYEAATGRYVESDPIGLGGGISTYGYVGGNPLSHVDYSGLAPGGCGGWKCIGPMPIYRVDIRYNAPPPRTVPVTGQTARALRCTVECSVISDSVLITGGAEQSGHHHGSRHYSNEAVDIAGPACNDADHSTVLACAAECGFDHGWLEDFPGNNRDHWHLQFGSGLNVPVLPRSYVPFESGMSLPGDAERIIQKVYFEKLERLRSNK